MKSDARASLDDLAIRWETPRGREIKAELIQDVKHNKGERIPDILKDFIYTTEIGDGRDLRCITLEDMDLTDTAWKGCDLSWASFARSTLTRADFRNAILKRANMVDVGLALSRFAEADCARVDFSRANLEHANFKDAKLNGAVFLGANCARASFDTANLTKGNFVGANLEQANFSNADCSNGNFSGSALDMVAARPLKAWGLRYDMPLDEFERQVGLNSLTSRTTKKFKGLEVLLKMSSALAKVQKKGPGPAAEDLALGAPPGMKRLETFKRPESSPDDLVVFGAGLRKKKDEEPETPSSDSVATAADYLEDSQQGDARVEPAGQGYTPEEAPTTTDEAVGAYWTDGNAPAEEGAPPVDAPAPPPPSRPATGRPAATGMTPRAMPRPAPAGAASSPSAPTPAAGLPRPGRTTQPLARQTGSIPRGPLAPGAPIPTAAPAQPPGVKPPTGKIPLPGGGAPFPGAPPSGRQTRNLGPSGAIVPAAGAPLPGSLARTTKTLGRPPGLGGPPTPPGAGPSSGAFARPPAPPAPVAPAPPPASASFARPATDAAAPVAPLDPAAPEPTTDWAKAIGQLMQTKSSITKIVVEMGDKSRVLFKKP
ncbi:pentapeptide repeat-containing protein [bacterium]|nr:pentapeptide repeat-containing protein [bacterium]